MGTIQPNSRLSLRNFVYNKMDEETMIELYNANVTSKFRIHRLNEENFNKVMSKLNYKPFDFVTRFKTPKFYEEDSYFYFNPLDTNEIVSTSSIKDIPDLTYTICEDIDKLKEKVNEMELIDYFVEESYYEYSPILHKVLRGYIIDKFDLFVDDWEDVYFLLESM